MASSSSSSSSHVPAWMRIAESAAPILDPEERTTILKKVRRQSLMAAKGTRRKSVSAPAHAPPGAHLAQHRAQLGSHAAAAAAVAAHAAAQGGGAAANNANAANTANAATTGADADGEAVSRLLDRAEYTGSPSEPAASRRRFRVVPARRRA